MAAPFEGAAFLFPAADPNSLANRGSFT